MNRPLCPSGIVCALALVLTFGACNCEEKVRTIVEPEQVDRTQPRKDSVRTAEHDREPNNRRSEAEPFSVKARSPAVFGTLETSKDIDWFHLRPEAGTKNLRVEVVVDTGEPAEALDLVLLLASDRDAPPHEYNQKAASESESLPSILVREEGLYLGVQAIQGSGPYQLSVRKRLAGGNVEAEPNDELNAVTPQPVGEFQGFFGRPGDRDAFWLTPQESQRIVEVGTQALPDRTLKLELYPVGQESPSMRLESKKGMGLHVPNLELPKDGIRMVLSLTDGVEIETPYRLMVRPLRSDELPLEVEPNDDAPQPMGTGTVMGFLHEATDVDRWTVDLTQTSEDLWKERLGRAATLPEMADSNTVGQTSAPPDMGRGPTEDRDATPGDMDSVARADEPPVLPAGQGDVKPALVSKKGPNPWLPYVRLRPLVPGLALSMEIANNEVGPLWCGQPTDTSSFAVSVRAQDLPDPMPAGRPHYRIDIENQADVRGIEIEPNDRAEDADVLYRNQKRQGLLESERDVDMYQFVVGMAKPSAPTADGGIAPSGAALPIEIVVTLGEGFQGARLEILDSEGGLVAKRPIEPSRGTTTRLDLELPEGRYVAVVAATQSNGCGLYGIEFNGAGQAEEVKQ